MASYIISSSIHPAQVPRSPRSSHVEACNTRSSLAVAYINHHPTEYNTEVRWATVGPWIHQEEWLEKPVSFLEEQWQSGLMLEFIALRDIQPGEEVLINYGDEWQKAWDEHVKNWEPVPPEGDYNNLTLWTKTSEASSGEGYVRAELLNEDKETPLKTMLEQAEDPYPHSIQINCKVNVNHRSAYLFEIETAPFFSRNWEESTDFPADKEERHTHKCNVTERYEKGDREEEEDSSDDIGELDDDEEGDEKHLYFYTVEIEAVKPFVGSEDGDAITEKHEIEYVPRRAIEFVNMRYTSDVFLKASFRHEMMLPDGIFPEAWRNRREGEGQ